MSMSKILFKMWIAGLNARRTDDASADNGCCTMTSAYCSYCGDVHCQHGDQQNHFFKFSPKRPLNLLNLQYCNTYNTVTSWRIDDINLPQSELTTLMGQWNNIQNCKKYIYVSHIPWLSHYCQLQWHDVIMTSYLQKLRKETWEF